MSLKMGLLGRKIGMTQVFHDDGTALGVTAVTVGPCVVVGKRTPEKHGYSALQLGFKPHPPEFVAGRVGRHHHAIIRIHYLAVRRA